MILLVTNQRDITSDYVVAELERRHVDYFRFNTDTSHRTSFYICPNEAGDVYFCDGEHKISLNDITAGYYRRPVDPVLVDADLDDGKIEYCISEWRCLLSSFYRLVGNKWLNKPWMISAAEDKIRQLFLAREIGFQIPKTIIGNDPTSLDNFRKSSPVIAKTIRTPLVHSNDEEFVIFTSRISASEDICERAFSIAPLIMQEEISKKFDLRVTVVGDQVFPVSIDSQSFEETSVDWRVRTADLLRHEIVGIPETIERQCVTLVRKMGLNFGAIDLIQDDHDRYWFLECNPNGQWAWIENRTGSRITEAIVRKLLEISHGN